MTKLTQITSLMADLDANDLAQISERAKAMIAVGGRPNHLLTRPDPDTVEIETLVLNHLAGVLTRRGIPFAHPAVMRKWRGMPALRAKLPELSRWLTYTKVDAAGQSALLRLALDLLYADLARMGVPTDAYTLAKHLHRVPAVMDKAFPGYYRAGLLSWVIDSHAPARQADRPDSPTGAGEPAHPALSQR